jgi:hypothetical protein
MLNLKKIPRTYIAHPTWWSGGTHFETGEQKRNSLEVSEKQQVLMQGKSNRKTSRKINQQSKQDFFTLCSHEERLAKRIKPCEFHYLFALYSLSNQPFRVQSSRQLIILNFSAKWLNTMMWR